MSKEDGKNRLYVNFSLSDGQGMRLNFSQDYANGVTWDALLKDVVAVLHGYGYVGIDERVFIQSPFTSDQDSLTMLRDIAPYMEEDHE